MLIRKIAIAGTLLVPIASVAVAEERRELGAHEHGHGTLNVAMDGDVVGIELRVPGTDIVGFEHEAKSDKDKAALKTAIDKLDVPLALFQLPAAAGCKVTSSKTEYNLDHDHENREDHKEEHNKEHADHDGGKHADEHHDEHAESKEAEAEHAEFHAVYQLTCTAPGKLTSIEFSYFGTFKNAEELEVNVATSKGQSQYEVTRDKPTLDLGGII